MENFRLVLPNWQLKIQDFLLAVELHQIELGNAFERIFGLLNLQWCTV